MIIKSIILIVVAVALVSCSRGAKAVADSRSAASETLNTTKTKKQADGLSFETAVLLIAKTQKEGVEAQHAWIRLNLPGAQYGAPLPMDTREDEEVVSFGQELAQHEGKLYSVIRLTMPDGKLRTVYFDITGYFGK
tara:strand:- start:194 stop:601 length:408 start_codon:yes stop_codon:yes gene_type:complete